MTDLSQVVDTVTSRAEFGANTMPYRIKETYWGYIIHKTHAARPGLVILQAGSMLLGAALTAAGLGLIILPDMLAGSTDFAMRAVASVFFLAVAAYLLWFASRGTQSEIQIDKSLGEVREVVRNRAGRSALIGRYGFDSIGGVFLDRANARNKSTATLALRYRNTAQTLPVVSGEIAHLEGLCKRVGRDLMAEAKQLRVEKTIVPTTL